MMMLVLFLIISELFHCDVHNLTDSGLNTTSFSPIAECNEPYEWHASLLGKKNQKDKKPQGFWTKSLIAGGGKGSLYTLSQQKPYKPSK